MPASVDPATRCRPSVAEALIYRMPVVFGPALGPRQDPDGVRYSNSEAPNKCHYSVRIRMPRESLADLCPPRTDLPEDPVVTVRCSYLENLPWLGGRGYNILSVSWPIIYATSSGRRVHGSFVPVLWENLADSVIIGREELGYPKLFAEIPPPAPAGDSVALSARWFGHVFATLSVSPVAGIDLAATSDPSISAEDRSASDNVFVYKYIPRTGAWGLADCEYMTFSSGSTSRERVVESVSMRGSVEFRRSTWQELPTMCHIVNALAALPWGDVVGGARVRTVGSTDYREQHPADDE